MNKYLILSAIEKCLFVFVDREKRIERVIERACDAARLMRIQTVME